MNAKNYHRLESFVRRQNTWLGLILPDGWFGRPFDNLLEGTMIRQTDGCVELTLSDWIRLSVAGPARTTIERSLRGDKAVISDFTEVLVQYVPIGTDEERSRKYTAGEVTLPELASK